jgi:hypothetical protein
MPSCPRRSPPPAPEAPAWTGRAAGGRRSCPRTGARAPGRSARRSGCPAPPAAWMASCSGARGEPPAPHLGPHHRSEKSHVRRSAPACPGPAPGQVHPVPQCELEQVRAAQPGIDLLCGSRQPTTGIVGDQEQKILSKQDAPALSSLHDTPDHRQSRPGRGVGSHRSPASGCDRTRRVARGPRVWKSATPARPSSSCA